MQVNNKKKYSIWDKLAVRLFAPELQHITEPRIKQEKSNIPYIFENSKIPNKQYIFDSIIGYADIKKVMQSMINSEHSVSILLSGSAGCGKSMFLKEILKFHNEESYYIDGSRASKAGIFDVLFEDKENKIKYLLIDEIDKLASNDQESLLTLIQDGKLIQTLKSNSRQKTYENLSVICASNHKQDLLYPLLTRLFVIPIKDYTLEEFKEITLRILPERYGTSEELANHIAEKIWTKEKIMRKEIPNIRDCEKIAKLSKNDINMVDMLLELTE